MNPLQKLLAWLIFGGAVLGGGLVGWVGGNMNGRAEGRQLERADHNVQTVKDLKGLIDSHQILIDQATAASRSMRQALASRAQWDATTSKEFKNALLATADSRAGCVFPADVMRQLSAARDRAAQAAAGGVLDPLPGAATGAQRPGG